MTRAEVRLDAISVFPPTEGSWDAVAEVASVGHYPSGQELEKTHPKRTRNLESPGLVMLQQSWQGLSGCGRRRRGKGCVFLGFETPKVELQGCAEGPGFPRVFVWPWG